MSCANYNGNISDMLIPPIKIYGSGLCLTYDKTNLFLTTVVRLFLYGFIYYMLLLNLKTNEYFEYIDNFMLLVLFLNVLSLSVVLSSVPAYIKNM